ncbi:hypothetical protein C8R46DRAFT_1106359 [Mycena filopes]|nr:hypothetical protein C8R46DRAFT_1106359 [Mycena filopes]
MSESISGDITAFIGRSPADHPGTGDEFMLWNYYHRKLVVVHTIGLESPFGASFEESVRQSKLTFVWLEKIQSLLHTIDFEHGDRRAYLIDTPSGPRIVQKSRKSRQPYRIPCDNLWAPRIDIRDIEITKMWAFENMIGRAIWRGKETTAYVAYDDLGLTHIEQTMKGLRALRGMDVTYEIVAHVFTGDELVGYLTESAAKSRPMRAKDRANVFAALSKLESEGFVYAGITDDERILIDENDKVRLLNLWHLRRYKKHQRKELEEDAREFHWNRATELFDGLGPVPASIPYWFTKPAATILAKTPSTRLLLITLKWKVDMPGAFLYEEQAKARRKATKAARERENAKTLEIGSLRKKGNPGPAVLANLARIKAITPPPPYTESYSVYPREKLPVFDRKHASGVLLAEEEPTTASIVELEA